MPRAGAEGTLAACRETAGAAMRRQWCSVLWGARGVSGIAVPKGPSFNFWESCHRELPKGTEPPK